MQPVCSAPGTWIALENNAKTFWTVWVKRFPWGHLAKKTIWVETLWLVTDVLGLKKGAL